MNVLIRIAFNGRSFYGTQRLPKDPTIQGVFEHLLSRIYNTPTKVTISSRLDRGVHALDFALTFVPPNETISLDHLQYYLKRSVPKDIFIKSIQQVDDSFSPRYDCLSKQYLYLIQNGKTKNPLFNPISYVPLHPLNKDIIKETLLLFKGQHDFRYFSSPEGDENTLLTIDDVSFDDKDDVLKIRFLSKAFLRYQVRFMVGACISVSLHHITIDQVKEMLNGIPNTKTKYKAEPQGLILEKINYPDIEEENPLQKFIFL